MGKSRGDASETTLLSTKVLLFADQHLLQKILAARFSFHNNRMCFDEMIMKHDSMCIPYELCHHVSH